MKEESIEFWKGKAQTPLVWLVLQQIERMEFEPKA